LKWRRAQQAYANLVEKAPGSSTSFRVTCVRTCKKLAYTSQCASIALAGSALDQLDAEPFNWVVDLHNFDVEVYCPLNSISAAVGMQLPKSESWSPALAHLTSMSLKQPIAYSMALLAEVKAGDVILDPMCGSGSLLVQAHERMDRIEMAKRGGVTAVKDSATEGKAMEMPFPLIHLVGGDIDGYAVEKAVLNIVDAGKHPIRPNDTPDGNAEPAFVAPVLSRALRSLVVWNLGSRDSGFPMREGSVDVIICDLPFGKRCSDAKANQKLYPMALQEFSRLLRRGTGRCVLLTSARALVNDTLTGPWRDLWHLDEEDGRQDGKKDEDQKKNKQGQKKIVREQRAAAKEAQKREKDRKKAFERQNPLAKREVSVYHGGIRCTIVVLRRTGKSYQEAKHRKRDRRLAKRKILRWLRVKLGIEEKPQQHPEEGGQLLLQPPAAKGRRRQKERNKRRQEEARSGKGGGKGGEPLPRRPGDWDCDECGVMNFASKSVCFKCKKGKKPLEPVKPVGGESVVFTSVVSTTSAPPLSITLLLDPPSTFRGVPRLLFTYWEGTSAAAQGCIACMRALNPGWRVVVLGKADAEAILLAACGAGAGAGAAVVVGAREGVTMNAAAAAAGTSMTAVKRSELCRLHAIATYGGVWLDASILCVRANAVEEWLGQYQHSTGTDGASSSAGAGAGGSAGPGNVGLCGYCYPNAHCEMVQCIESWMFAAPKDHGVVQSWFREFVSALTASAKEGAKGGIEGYCSEKRQLLGENLSTATGAGSCPPTAAMATGAKTPACWHDQSMLPYLTIHLTFWATLHCNLKLLLHSSGGSGGGGGGGGVTTAAEDGAQQQCPLVELKGHDAHSPLALQLAGGWQPSAFLRLFSSTPVDELGAPVVKLRGGERALVDKVIADPGMLNHFVQVAPAPAVDAVAAPAVEAATTAAAWVESLMPARPSPLMQAAPAQGPVTTASGSVAAANADMTKVLTPLRLLLESHQPAERLLLRSILGSTVSMRA
jgi:hypothetical protein